MNNKTYKDRLLNIDFDNKSNYKEAQNLVEDAFYFCQRCICELYSRGKKEITIRVRDTYHTFTLNNKDAPIFKLVNINEKFPTVNWDKIDDNETRDIITLLCFADGLTEYFLYYGEEDRGDEEYYKSMFPTVSEMEENDSDFFLYLPIIESLEDFWKPSTRLIHIIEKGIKRVHGNKETFTIKDFITTFATSHRFSTIPGCGKTTVEELKKFFKELGIIWE